MSFDAYIKLDEVKGEATAKGFEGQLDVFSFSLGASNPAQLQGGGMGAGKVSLSSFNFMKKSDGASPQLFLKCCSGKPVPKAVVTLRKAGGEQMPFLVFELGDVMVESIQWSGSSGGDDTPTESVSIAFSKISITYNTQDKTGKKKDSIAGSWDLAAVSGK